MPSLVRRPPLPKRPVILVNLALGALVLGGGAWAYTSIRQPSDGRGTDSSTRIVAVTEGTVTASASADGTVRSASTATADFATSGTVTEIRVKVGDVVKKGEVLAKVDPTAARRALDRAEADLAAAKEALSRSEEADQDTSAAEAQVTQAELDVADAQSAVDGTVLTAPMAGTVVAVNGTVGGSSGGGSSGGSSGGDSTGGLSGGNVSGDSSGGRSSSSSSSSSGSSSEGGGFIEIQDLSKLEVSASFAEADATRIKPGQAATVTWNALAGTSVTGTVTTVDPSATISNNVVSYGVTISLDRVPAAARPGQTTSVEVITGEVSGVVRVPAAAVTTAGSRSTVTVVENGVPTRRAVTVGLEGDAFTEIKSGLAVGEQVAITVSNSGGTFTFPSGVLPGGGLLGGGPGGGAVPGRGGANGGGQRTGGGR